MESQIILRKTCSGTDWEAYQVVKTDTARWVEDDVNSQVKKNIDEVPDVSIFGVTKQNRGKEINMGQRSDDVDTQPDILNPYSDYAKGYYDGYNDAIKFKENQNDRKR